MDSRHSSRRPAPAHLVGFAVALLTTGGFALCQGSSQIIRGTRVQSEVAPDSRTVRFSNECGSQTLSANDLQAGALPTQIVPCPRPDLESASEAALSDCMSQRAYILKKIGPDDVIRMSALRKATAHLKAACAKAGRPEVVRSVERAIAGVLERQGGPVPLR